MITHRIQLLAKRCIADNALVIPLVLRTRGAFTFIKCKWYYSLVLRELRWYFLLIPHLQKIQQFMKQMIVIYLQQMRALAPRA